MMRGGPPPGFAGVRGAQPPGFAGGPGKAAHQEEGVRGRAASTAKRTWLNAPGLVPPLGPTRTGGRATMLATSETQRGESYASAAFRVLRFAFHDSNRRVSGRRKTEHPVAIPRSGPCLVDS